MGGDASRCPAVDTGLSYICLMPCWEKSETATDALPVSGAFDNVGVDVLQLPWTRKGNRYNCHGRVRGIGMLLFLLTV